jgi:hypothetical protein
MVKKANGVKIALKDISEDDLYQYAMMDTGSIFSYKIGDKEIDYKIAKVEYGETAGYRETDLVYPGDLIAMPGDTIVSILDKIKTFFGTFEYFYDVDGHFIF